MEFGSVPRYGGVHLPWNGRKGGTRVQADTWTKEHLRYNVIIGRRPMQNSLHKIREFCIVRPVSKAAKFNETTHLSPLS